MRPRIQVKYVTEHMNYLKENINVIKPVVEALQVAVQNSKTWLEDKSDNKSLTYCDLCQELESATTAMLDVAEHILDENKNTVDTEGRSFSYQSTPQPTATEDHGSGESTDHNLKKLHQSSDILCRLEQIETTMYSIQVTNIKSTNDITEIKQWRDNFVTEQSDMGVNIEQLTKKQKQNFKNLRKQMSEQDNKVKELNKEFESLKENESKSNKTLEKLSLDMKEYENNLLKINKEIQFYIVKTDSITDEIKRHSEMISSLQEDNNKMMVNTSTKLEKLQSKHNVMYKVLQQRLMPIDKLIQIFNQNLENREGRINKIDNFENASSMFSKEFHLIVSRVCNRYACHVRLAYDTPVSEESIISTFKEVHEFNGQHFNQTTGKFVSPHDGLYLVCVTLNECEDKLIRVAVSAGDVWWTAIEVKCAATSAAGSVVVDMKKSQELYFVVYHADQGAKLSWLSTFTIVSL